uniref:Uncharacterized protein n=1 Tax=Anguilla anguilla TaxID=7936 RepID=A0A0E9QL19_ANGAN
MQLNLQRYMQIGLRKIVFM